MRVEVLWPAIRGWGHRGGIAPRGCKSRLCPLLRRGSGQPDDHAVRGHRPGNAPFSSGVMDPPRRDRLPCLSPTLGPHDEDTACLEKMRRRSRGVLVTEGLKTNETAVDVVRPRGETTREPGGWGRCPATRARRRAHEDCARPPRWSATAETVLPGRSRRVRRCGRIGRNCTTRRPSVPGSTSPSPPCHGERPARASSPWEARPATASEGR